MHMQQPSVAADVAAGQLAANAGPHNDWADQFGKMRLEQAGPPSAWASEFAQVKPHHSCISFIGHMSCPRVRHMQSQAASCLRSLSGLSACSSDMRPNGKGAHAVMRNALIEVTFEVMPCH